MDFISQQQIDLILKYYDAFGFPIIIIIGVCIGLSYYYYKMYKIDKGLYSFTVYVLTSIKEQILNPIQIINYADEKRYEKEFGKVLRDLKNKSRIKGIIYTLEEFYKKYKMENFLNLAIVLKSGDVKSAEYMLRKVITLNKIIEKKENSFGEVIALLIILSLLTTYIPFLVKLLFKEIDPIFLIWTYYFFLSFNLSIAFPVLIKIYQKKRYLSYIFISLISIFTYLGFFVILIY